MDLKTNNNSHQHLDDWQINFTKPASQIAEAFYLVMKLGKEGYQKQLYKCINTSKIVSKYLNLIKNRKGKKLFIEINEDYYPVLTYYLNDSMFPLKEVLETLENKHGYSIPAYRMGNTDDIVFRLVFKPNVTISQAKNLRDAFKIIINRYSS